MKSLLIKYRRNIVLSALVILIILFILPAQEQYYLRADLSRFTEIVQLFMISLACLFAGVVLVLGLWHIQNIKGLATVAYNVVTIGILFFCAYFIFNPILKAGFLLANRAIAWKEVNRSFVVSDSAGDSTNRQIYALQDGKFEQVWDNQIIEDHATILGLKSEDTFQITFAKGLFGVYYIHDESLRK